MLSGRLSTQVGLVFFGSIALVVSTISWQQYGNLKRELPAQIEHEALQHAEIIAESIAANVLYRKSYTLWSQMDKTMRRFKNDAFIRMSSFAVVDEQNQVLAHSDPMQFPLLSQLKPAQSGLTWDMYRVTVVTPVLHPSSSRHLGMLTISYDASTIQQQLALARNEFLLFLLISLAISALLALGVRQRVARPLKELIALAARIGTGKVDSKSFHGKPKEIRDLADSLQAADMALAGKSREIERLAAVTAQADELVIITDTQGVIQYVNPAFEKTSGYSAQEAVGHSPRMVKSGEHDAAYYARMWQSISAGKVWRDDFKNRKKDGSIYEVTQSIFPIVGAEGAIVAYAAVQRDVTQLRRVEEKLHHTDRVESLGVLAGGIAHDFNNLLTAILGNAALAMKKLDHSAPAYGHIERIENASHSAADLCRQMLAYSGKGHFVIKPVSLSVLLEGMSKLVEVSIAKNIVLKYRLDAELPLINADVAQIQQVILNLITNASEAIGERSGVITMATGQMDAGTDYLFNSLGTEHLAPGQYVYLEVSDNGCGMTPEIQKKIFDPFFTTKFTGRGLGMSAMLGIVQGHKGALRIYSEPGQGTSIRVLFPVSDAQEPPDTSAVIQPQHQARGSVLVVDDEPTVREVVSAMLEDMGYAVLLAEDGCQGVAMYRQYQQEIGMVILDMTMPKMDGVECFRQLRQINAAVKVVLSSGYNEQEATGSFTGKGLAGFIQKPYSPHDLADKLASVFDKG